MEALVLQQPAAPRRLFLLFHGVGASPRDLAPLGLRLAGEFPDAAVVSVPGPDRSDFGSGWQWFSVAGVTEENRPARVAATLPRFLATVQRWQAQTGVDAAGTTLVGFSQGAIMSLEASLSATPPAARFVSLSGRFAEVPAAAPAGVRVHFLHGEADPVIPVAHARNGARALGDAATLDLLPGLAHGISEATQALLLQRLRAP
jgi:phospholipase/carboxylesterase